MQTISKIAIATAFLGLGAVVSLAQNTAGTSPSTNSTVDGAASPKQGQKEAPGTVGAMNNATDAKATNPDDVKRQTEGKQTMAEEGKSGKSGEGSKPDMTQHSPGTVGASPGTTPPAQAPAK